MARGEADEGADAVAGLLVGQRRDRELLFEDGQLLGRLHLPLALAAALLAAALVVIVVVVVIRPAPVRPRRRCRRSRRRGLVLGVLLLKLELLLLLKLELLLLLGRELPAVVLDMHRVLLLLLLVVLVRPMRVGLGLRVLRMVVRVVDVLRVVMARGPALRRLLLLRLRHAAIGRRVLRVELRVDVLVLMVRVELLLAVRELLLDPDLVLVLLLLQGGHVLMVLVLVLLHGGHVVVLVLLMMVRVDELRLAVRVVVNVAREVRRGSSGRRRVATTTRGLRLLRGRLNRRIVESAGVGVVLMKLLYIDVVHGEVGVGSLERLNPTVGSELNSVGEGKEREVAVPVDSFRRRSRERRWMFARSSRSKGRWRAFGESIIRL